MAVRRGIAASAPGVDLGFLLWLILSSVRGCSHR
jgi:hypothetical protein